MRLETAFLGLLQMVADGLDDKLGNMFNGNVLIVVITIANLCFGGVVRPIISAFRAEDSGSNPDRSTILVAKAICVAVFTG